MRKYLLFFTLLLSNILWSQTLRIAVYQYADNPRIKNLQPLAAHLQRQLQVTTSVKSYPTVHALIEGIQNNEVDVAFISTFGYLLLQAGKENHPMMPLAALIAPHAKDNYKTPIVTNKASLSSLDHLAKAGDQTRMAFVATGSTSGNLVPRLLLSRINITDADRHFASITYAGTHAKALQLLLSDSVDVAAMGSTEWDKLDSVKKASLHLLLLSSEIPLGPVLVNKGVPTDLRMQITTSLLDLHRSNFSSLEAIKAAWSEAKQATHFIAIKEDYYLPYLKQFGSEKEVAAIIRKFVQ